MCVLRLCSVSSLVCGGGLWTKNEACSSLPLVGLVGDFVFVFGEFGEWSSVWLLSLECWMMCPHHVCCFVCRIAGVVC